MPKKSSETAASRKAVEATPEQIDGFVAAHADKSYALGSTATKALQSVSAPEVMQVKKAVKKESDVAKARPLSISLPPEIVEQLEDQALENKRSGDGPKTISGILREILEEAGYTGATARNK
jgi:hypothetical protein